MSNLIEVLPGSSSHVTPGWTYVPAGYGGSSRAKNASGTRKRAAREIGGGRGNASSRQENATLRHLAELDRENHKDVHIPVPNKRKENAASKGSRSKTTSNVRRILMSQKTFKNYLDDEEAALGQTAPSAATQRPSISKVTKPNAPSPKSSVSGTPKPRGAEPKKLESTSEPSAAPSQTSPAAQQPPASSQLIVSEADNDPLLRSYIPSAPSDRIMQQLLAEPPLSYNESRAKLAMSGPGAAKPRRRFCGICGYWGHVKCKKCAARVCGLDCYRIHEETRCDRFYA